MTPALTHAYSFCALSHSVGVHTDAQQPQQRRNETRDTENSDDERVYVSRISSPSLAVSIATFVAYDHITQINLVSRGHARFCESCANAVLYGLKLKLKPRYLV